MLKKKLEVAEQTQTDVAARKFYEKEMANLKRKTKQEVAAERQKCTKAQNSRDKYYKDNSELREELMNHKSEVKGNQQQIQKLKEELAATNIDYVNLEAQHLAE